MHESGCSAYRAQKRGIPSKRGGLLAVLILGLSALVAPVFAHSDLKESRPVEGQTVRTPLDRIDLIFWSSFSDPNIEVIGPGGEPIAGVMTQVDLTVQFETTPLTREGEYLVRYEVRSTDSDVSSGEFSFVYDPTPASGSSVWLILVAAATLSAGVAWLVLRRDAGPPPNPPGRL